MPASSAPALARDDALDSVQQLAVDLVVRRQKNVFLTGQAGVGKTRVIREVVRQALQLGKRVALTATTGLAAANLSNLFSASSAEEENNNNNNRNGNSGVDLEAMTLHRFSGVRPNVYSVSALLDLVAQSKFLLRRWQSTQLLIVDEISMCSPVLFEMIDQLARRVRNRVDVPFGGIVCLFVGDFYQLSPVMRDEVELAKAAGKTYCFESKAFQNAVDYCVVLERVYRQQGDDEFVRILQEVRAAALSPRSVAVLKSRTCTALFDRLAALAGIDSASTPDLNVLAVREQLQRDGVPLPDDLLPVVTDVEPTKLMSTNAQVDAENHRQLAALDHDDRSNPTMLYHAQLDCFGPGVRNEAQASAIKNALRSGVLAPPLLTLKRGAQVMLLANLSGTLFNGRRGVVIDFRAEPPDARPQFLTAANGKRRRRPLRYWEADKPTEAAVAGCAAESGTPPLWPLVRFDNGVERLIVPYAWRRDCKRPRWDAALVQVPLKLAWAISVHKSQGMTISLLSVDLREVFTAGQAYVALSRATCLNGLMLEEFDESMCTDPSQAPNEKVVRLYKKMSAKQRKWMPAMLEQMGKQQQVV